MWGSVDAVVAAGAGESVVKSMPKLTPANHDLPNCKNSVLLKDPERKAKF